MCPQGPVPARRNRRQVRVARPDTPAADRSARLHRRGLQLRRAPSRRRTLPAPARTHMALGQAGIAACQTPPLCSARARLLRLLRVHLAAPGGRRCVAPTGRDDGEGRGRRASPTRRAHAVERACRSPCRRLRWPGRQSCRPWQWRQRHHQQQQHTRIWRAPSPCILPRCRHRCSAGTFLQRLLRGRIDVSTQTHRVHEIEIGSDTCKQFCGFIHAPPGRREAGARYFARYTSTTVPAGSGSHRCVLYGVYGVHGGD